MTDERNRMTVRQWLDEQTYPAQDENLSCNACVYIKKGEGRSLKSGGLWIYDNELDHTDGDWHDGDVLRVLDFDGYPLGFGFINSRSKIRVRMLCRYEKDQVTPALIQKRVRDAWNYRKAVMGRDVSCCRLVFGEADFLPGITIDRFEDVLVIESLALGTDRLKLLILRNLSETMAEDGITVRGIYERSDAKVRLLEGMEQRSGFIGPEFDTRVPITENGVRYIVDVKDGQKTGFFLDQKYNRVAVSKIVRNLAVCHPLSFSDKDTASDDFAAEEIKPQDSDDKPTENGRSPLKVLDCFTHTGSFGLNAALAGASRVLSVDASQTAISQAAENAKLNGFKTCGPSDGKYDTVSDGRLDKCSGQKAFGVNDAYSCGDVLLTNGSCTIKYLTADVFGLLPELEKGGEKYDVVILDPPAFAKSRKSVKNAVKGYREINMRGMRLVKNGGFLATCSCSHFMDEELFKKTLKEAAHGARKRLRQVEFRTQAPDHPILWGDDESYYLKFVIFQVLDEI